MTTDPKDRTPDDLEREVDAERARVAETIDALQEKVSVGGIVDTVFRQLSEHGGDVGRNFGRQVRDNPLPLILTGVGLAWLMSSSGNRPRRYDYRDEDYLWDLEEDEWLREETAVRRPPPYPPREMSPYGGADLPHGSDPALRPGATGAGTMGSATAGASTGSSAGSAGSSGPGVGDRLKGAAGAASDSAGRTAGAMSDSASRTAGAVSEGTGRAAGAVSAGAGRAAGTVSDAAGRAGGAISSGARGVADGARAGLSRAGDGARYAGNSVRSSAVEARRRAMLAGRASRERFEHMLEEQPLVLGALALAAGAAIGGALPRTRTEDEWIGEQSDRLKESARAMAVTEAEKAQRVAGAVADEARNMADEAAGEADKRTPDGKSMVDQAKATATGAAERLQHRAEDEAKKQDLGSPKT